MLLPEVAPLAVTRRAARRAGLLMLLAVIAPLGAAPWGAAKSDEAARRELKYQDLLRLSGDRLGRGMLPEALRYARSAQKVLPAQPDALTLQAVILAEQGASEAAGQAYRRAAELAPGSGDVLNNYGAWLCGQGHAAEALVWFDRAIGAESASGRASALANAGGCALQAGQYERAERDLRQALALMPDNAYALESMARSEFELGRYLEARAFSQRRLAAAPATISVLQLAIHIEDRLGDSSASSLYQQRLRDEFPVPAAANPQG